MSCVRCTACIEHHLDRFFRSEVVFLALAVYDLVIFDGSVGLNLYLCCGMKDIYYFRFDVVCLLVCFLYRVFRVLSPRCS